MHKITIISDKPKSITLNNEVSVITLVTLRWFLDNPFFVDGVKIDLLDVTNISGVTLYSFGNCEWLIKLPSGAAADAEIEFENKHFKVVKSGEERGVVFGNSYYVADEISVEKDVCTLIKNLSPIHSRVVVLSSKLEEDYIAIKCYSEASGDSIVGFASSRMTPNNLAMLFLQCVKFKDYENAKKLTSIPLTNSHIKEFFGEFEMLPQWEPLQSRFASQLPLKGMLNNETFVYIARKTINPNYFTTEKLNFKIENGLIVDLSFV